MSRPQHYAVQLTDIAVRAYNTTIVDPALILLRPVLTKITVQVKSEDTLDNMGLLLDDSDPERLDAILQVLRMKIPQHKLRLYQSETGKGGWKTARIRKVEV